MRIILNYLNSLFHVIFEGRRFPRCIYINKVIYIEDFSTSVDKGHLYGVCFAAFPKKGLTGKQLSSIDIYVKPNSDSKMVDVYTHDVILGAETIQFLGTVKRYEDNDLIFHLTHRRGVVDVELKLCPSSKYAPSTITYTMPVARWGYTW
jgi:hypothetical protein